MKAEIAELWIDRLLNGGITQTVEILGSPDGSRCCLGVLCDLAVEAGVLPAPVVWTQHDAIAKGKRAFLAYGAFVADAPEPGACVLPDEVILWAEMHSHNGGYNPIDFYPVELVDKFAEYLAADNDAGWTFAEIAELINQHKQDL